MLNEIEIEQIEIEEMIKIFNSFDVQDRQLKLETRNRMLEDEEYRRYIVQLIKADEQEKKEENN
jgi:hypothetical protein